MKKIIYSEKKELSLYEGFINAVSGETFRCISYDQDAFIFEWMVQPNGYVPFEHIHLHQDEVFRIKKGEARIVIEGKEIIAKTGDTVRVPKGKAHIAFNNTQGLLECVVSYEPGLDTFKFFQCFGGLTVDGDMDKKGQINIPKMLYFGQRMKARCLARPTSIPAPIFRLANAVCHLAGMLLGWEKDYQRYTRHDPEWYRPML